MKVTLEKAPVGYSRAAEYRPVRKSDVAFLAEDGEGVIKNNLRWDVGELRIVLTPLQPNVRRVGLDTLIEEVNG